MSERKSTNISSESEDERQDTANESAMREIQEIDSRSERGTRKSREGNLPPISSVAPGTASNKPPSFRRESASVKPPSQVSMLSKKGKSSSEKQAGPNADADGDSSFAESIQTGQKLRRTEEERVFYFKNQPECTDIEPHRVRCIRCGSFVNLGKNRAYTVRPWEVHRAKCDATVVDAPHKNNTVAGNSELDSKDAESSMGLSTNERVYRSESERKAYLETDEQVEEVQPDQVKCRRCWKWIRLSTKQTYALYHWRQHRERCPASTPSNRVVTAARKLQLVNDPQAKLFDVKQVECSACGVNVTLEGHGDYNLTKWDEHKVNCHLLDRSAVSELERSPNDPSEAVNIIPFPTDDNKAEECIPGLEQCSGESLKRVRSDSDAHSDMEYDRPVTRPRTEHYTASDADAPGTLGWVLEPFRAFVRGFRESLRANSPQNT